jgi:hypothetical protein
MAKVLEGDAPDGRLMSEASDWVDYDDEPVPMVDACDTTPAPVCRGAQTRMTSSVVPASVPAGPAVPARDRSSSPALKRKADTDMFMGDDIISPLTPKSQRCSPVLRSSACSLDSEQLRDDLSNLFLRPPSAELHEGRVGSGARAAGLVRGRKRGSAENAWDELGD